MIRKRRNKCPLLRNKKLLISLHCQEDIFKGKSKNTGKDFGSDGLLEEQNEKGIQGFSLIQSLWYRGSFQPLLVKYTGKREHPPGENLFEVKSLHFILVSLGIP